jgi:hypothetical protein
LGVALGSWLVQELGFRWAVATDEFGTDLAVVARRGRGDVTIYPTDFVSKRLERGEPRFFVDAFNDINRELERIAAEWGDSKLEST